MLPAQCWLWITTLLPMMESVKFSMGIGIIFTIEGFAHFGVDVGDDEVQQLLLGFEVRRYDFSLDAYTMICRVTAISLFTKHDTSWDHGYVHFRPQNLFDYFNQDTEE